jgi:hypothetical protein
MEAFWNPDLLKPDRLRPWDLFFSDLGAWHADLATQDEASARHTRILSTNANVPIWLC